MEPDKLNWLDEVREDAKYNHLRRIREQKEREEYESRKAAGRPMAVVSPEGPASDSQTKKGSK